jgi:hypothetical protein
VVIKASRWPVEMCDVLVIFVDMLRRCFMYFVSKNWCADAWMIVDVTSRISLTSQPLTRHSTQRINTSNASTHQRNSHQHNDNHHDTQTEPTCFGSRFEIVQLELRDPDPSPPISGKS